MKIIKTILLTFILFSNIFSQNQPYVLLISFDGFRWDYCERGITPNIDEYKMNGVQATSLRPVFPSKTFPNHYSIVTGMFPENHGIISNSFKNPFAGENYRISDTIAVREGKWYLSEAFWETARRNNIITASYFWPGSEINIENRRPDYYKKYQHDKPYKERIDGVIEWLSLPNPTRPHFITLYFDAADTYGHKFGPNSIELNQTVQRLDTLIGYLNSELSKLSISDSINIILVSDHGMTEVSHERLINIDEILHGFNYSLEGEKSFGLIETSIENSNNIYSKLKESENHYKVYLKEELPNYFHYSKHPFISEIIIIPETGWSLVGNKSLKGFANNYSKGNHGYDNNNLDMHGIFIANGPLFKNNYKTGTIFNIDIYPLLAKIFNISPRANIDGDLDRIEFILK